jgi:hypothetical protein
MEREGSSLRLGGKGLTQESGTTRQRTGEGQEQRAQPAAAPQRQHFCTRARPNKQQMQLRRSYSRAIPARAPPPVKGSAAWA